MLVAIGVLSAIFLLRSMAHQIQVDPDTIVDLAIATVISGFIGARIFYVVQSWDYFQLAPFDIIKIWEGGIVAYGGIIGGLIGFTSFVKFKRLPFLPLLDMFVMALALAQGFGRFGCFLNGCCFGKPTNLPWGVLFPFAPFPVHPTQLYEAVFCFALAIFLLLIFRKNLRTGTISALYFIIYPAGRFLIEFVRGDNEVVFFIFTAHQIISMMSIGITLIVVFMCRFVWKKNRKF